MLNALEIQEFWNFIEARLESNGLHPNTIDVCKSSFFRPDQYDKQMSWTWGWYCTWKGISPTVTEEPQSERRVINC